MQLEKGPRELEEAAQDPSDDHSALGSHNMVGNPSRGVASVLAHLARCLPTPLRERLTERDLPWLVLAVTITIGAILAVGATAISAEVYDGVEDGDGISVIDQPTLERVADVRTPALNDAVTAFTELGGTHLMAPATVIAAALLWWRYRRPLPVLLVAIAAAGSLAMTIVGKHAIGRARPPYDLAVPPYEASPAFPSGHTLNSWVLWLLIGYLIAANTQSRRIRLLAPAVAVVLAVLMGLSRVYLGHHWLTDVLVGWTLGTAWLAVVITGHRVALTVGTQPSGPRRRSPET